jgi:hypothetical protein
LRRDYACKIEAIAKQAKGRAGMGQVHSGGGTAGLIRHHNRTGVVRRLHVELASADVPEERQWQSSGSGFVQSRSAKRPHEI